ncbi:helicase [Synergistales bacterium]|nr:helicase [Synergistales bacterium]
MKTAILIDGAYFINHSRKIFGSLTPEELADRLLRYSCYHIPKNKDLQESLYRIFFYDCPPLNKKMEHPLTKKQIDYSKSDRAKWRLAFHDVLRRKPKVALRLGALDEINYSWTIADKKIRKLCRGEITVQDLVEDDVTLSVKQKGVDMRIGLDIASLAYKKQVECIVLIAGDSDFVPTAKMARREGIEFVLDPMWAPIKPDLQEHIDRLRSTFPKPKSADIESKG